MVCVLTRIKLQREAVSSIRLSEVVTLYNRFLYSLEMVFSRGRIHFHVVSSDQSRYN